MCPGKIGIISIILIFLIFLIFTIHVASDTKNTLLLIHQNYYINKQIPIYSNRIESLSNNDEKYKVTIIGSVHGNEPVGYHALTDMINKEEFTQYYDNADFYIFAEPNEYGIKNNTRNSLWGDINRSWPKEYGPLEEYGKLIYPVKTMMPYINNVDLVIDIHEAVGYHRCQKSLGNTMYISDSSKKYLLQPIIDELNNKLKIENKICDQWDIITELPPTLNNTGTLDEYINCIPNVNRPFYILIEIPGQNNIQPLEKRIKTAKFLIHNILSNLSNF